MTLQITSVFTSVCWKIVLTLFLLGSWPMFYCIASLSVLITFSRLIGEKLGTNRRNSRRDDRRPTTGYVPHKPPSTLNILVETDTRKVEMGRDSDCGKRAGRQRRPRPLARQHQHPRGLTPPPTSPPPAPPPIAGWNGERMWHDNDKRGKSTTHHPSRTRRRGRMTGSHRPTAAAYSPWFLLYVHLVFTNTYTVYVTI